MNQTRTAVVADVATRVIESQGVYRRYANTINATLAALAGAVAALAGIWTISGEFPAVTGVLVFLAPILTAVATRLTKNGMSPGVERDLVAAARAEDQGQSSVGLPVYHGPTTAG